MLDDELFGGATSEIWKLATVTLGKCPIAGALKLLIWRSPTEGRRDGVALRTSVARDRVPSGPIDKGIPSCDAARTALSDEGDAAPESSSASTVEERNLTFASIRVNVCLQSLASDHCEEKGCNDAHLARVGRFGRGSRPEETPSRMIVRSGEYRQQTIEEVTRGVN